MPLTHFIFFIICLYFLETSLLPGLFTAEISLHISLLLLLSFMYQARSEWMLGLLAFTLLLPFSFTQSPLLLTIIYASHVGFAYFLTQSLLGARSFSSYVLYAGIMSFTLSLSTALLFDTSWQRGLAHFVFAFIFLLVMKTLFPLRVRTFLSTV